jgi:hypothetical protein
MHELNMYKIRPEKSDQAIGPELQVTVIVIVFSITITITIT